ncbi:hypothetical protein A2U01_0049775, partial [Trifolium medium]|nr:hypothetical protein [Trifolium medium]
TTTTTYHHPARPVKSSKIVAVATPIQDDGAATAKIKGTKPILSFRGVRPRSKV